MGKAKIIDLCRLGENTSKWGRENLGRNVKKGKTAK
jgi:hypothetical protein